MAQRSIDDAGRQYEIERVWEKDGKWYGCIDWLSRGSDPVRAIHSMCLVPGEYDTEEAATEAAENFARNNRPE